MEWILTFEWKKAYNGEENVGWGCGDHAAMSIEVVVAHRGVPLVGFNGYYIICTLRNDFGFAFIS